MSTVSPASNRADALPARLRVLALAAVAFFQTVTHMWVLTLSASPNQVALPWLMNRGYRLYDNLIVHRAMGTGVLIAWLQPLFGDDVLLTVRVAHTALVLATTALVFVLARRLLGDGPALLAVLFFALIEPVYGNILFYFDAALALCYLLACLSWVSIEERGWRGPLLAGLILGLGVHFKQHAVVMVGVVMIWRLGVGLYVRETFRRVFRDIMAFCVGAAVFPLLGVVYALAQGVLAPYLYWNYIFNLTMKFPGVLMDGAGLRKMLFLWALVPVFLLRTAGGTTRRAPRAGHWLVLAYWLGAQWMLYERFGEIHFVAQVPFIAIMSGAVLWELLPLLARLRGGGWRVLAPSAQFTLGVGAVVAFAWVWMAAVSYLPTSLGVGATTGYDELRPLAAWLRAHSEPGDAIYSIPEQDVTTEIYALSGLEPPGFWVYGLSHTLRAPGVTERILDHFAQNPPRYILYYPTLAPTAGPEGQPLVDYMNACYTRVEVFETGAPAVGPAWVMAREPGC